MFNYCHNNPTNLVDVVGTRPVLFTGKEETKEEYEWSIGQMAQNPINYWNRRGVHIKDNGSTIQIENSYKITSDIDMTEYAMFLMHKSKYSDFFKGSVAGFVFEWTVHNEIYKVAAAVGNTARMDQAKSLDVGPTIYSDNHGNSSRLMIAVFEILYPIEAEQDRRIHYYGE